MERGKASASTEVSVPTVPAGYNLDNPLPAVDEATLEKDLEAVFDMTGSPVDLTGSPEYGFNPLEPISLNWFDISIPSLLPDDSDSPVPLTVLNKLHPLLLLYLEPLDVIRNVPRLADAEYVCLPYPFAMIGIEIGPVKVLPDNAERQYWLDHSAAVIRLLDQLQPQCASGRWTRLNPWFIENNSYPTCIEMLSGNLTEETFTSRKGYKLDLFCDTMREVYFARLNYLCWYFPAYDGERDDVGRYYLAWMKEKIEAENEDDSDGPGAPDTAVRVGHVKVTSGSAHSESEAVVESADEEEYAKPVRGKRKRKVNAADNPIVTIPSQPNPTSEPRGEPFGYSYLDNHHVYPGRPNRPLNMFDFIQYDWRILAGEKNKSNANSWSSMKRAFYSFVGFGLIPSHVRARAKKLNIHI